MFSPSGSSAVVSLIISVSALAVAGIHLEEFYPYGLTAGDRRLSPAGDASHSSLELSVPFVFYGVLETTVYIYANGFLSFTNVTEPAKPVAFPVKGLEIVAPCWMQRDSRETGDVFFRETKVHNLLSTAADMIQEGFPDIRQKAFVPHALLIVTWNNVGCYNHHKKLTSSFQCILATDGTKSVIWFLYADSEEAFKDTSKGLDSTTLSVGINAGDGIHYFRMLSTLRAFAINVAERGSNDENESVWMFQIESAEVRQTRDAPAAPTNCTSAGFTECCNERNCSVAAENCFCDSSCYIFLDCCEDIQLICPPNECTLNTDTCDQNAVCTDTDEGFNCTCNPGYNGTGFNCADINECANSSGGCEHNCTNTPGSFFCVCDEGFLLDVDGVSCLADECALASGNCSQNAVCVNTREGFQCLCSSGYTGNGFSCTDIDECASENNPCEQLCRNTNGSFECECEEGFVLNQDGISCRATGCVSSGFTECCLGQCFVAAGNCFCDRTCFGFNDCCEDLPEICPPECTLGEDTCGENAQCVNTTDGSFCLCNTGYIREGSSCIDVDECITGASGSETPGFCEQTCTNVPGSFQCSCRDGFQLAQDGFSCTATNCQSAGFGGCCTNDCFVGGGNCFCDEGCYLFNDCCSDITEICPPDECILNLDSCDPNAICTDTFDGFECTCNPGFIDVANGTICNDINECSDSVCEQDCENLPGSFQCGCQPGYFLAADGVSCFIDECGTGTLNCSENATCVNAINGSICVCNVGYSGNGSVCEDIDECNSDGNTCAQICSNTFGSFECSCSEGFVLDSNGVNCLAVRCGSAGFPTCCSGSCFVEAGNCFCDPRCYEFDDCCEDITETCSLDNECALGTDTCDVNAQCIDTLGSFDCFCNSGYTGNGMNCTDIDECNTPEGDDESASGVGPQLCEQLCINLPGSFRCGCMEGFLLDSNGFTCLDIDECNTTSDDFSEGASGVGPQLCEQLCINLPGSFRCGCMEGFLLDSNGFNCLDVDECNTTPDDDFSESASGVGPQLCEQLCINLPGSFRCGCMEGFLLDSNGFTCLGVDAALQQAVYTVRENASAVQVCVELGRIPSSNFTLLLETRDGTARAPDDYLGLDVELEFSPTSSTIGCVDILVIDDGILENEEYFSVILSTNDSEVETTQDSAVISIIDDDVADISLVNSIIEVVEDVGRVPVCVSLTGELTETVTVYLETQQGTAEAGRDYNSTFEVITYTPATPFLIICARVPIVNDRIAENPESFTVQLTTTDPSISHTVNSAQVIILDDDRIVISFEQTAYSFLEGLNPVNICITLDGILLQEQRVSVNVSTQDGTATAGEDYQPIEQVLLFGPTTANRCVAITILEDNVREEQESFTVRLESADSAVLFVNNSATINIIDNDVADISLVNTITEVMENAGRVPVCVSLTGELTETVTVYLETQQGTAEAGRDYTSTFEVITYTPATSFLVICARVPIVNDRIAENPESFTVQLTTTVPIISLTVDSAQVIILDDDNLL